MESSFSGSHLEEVQKHQGKKILVIVGVEHSYWLRKELQVSGCYFIKAGTDFEISKNGSN